VPRPRPAFGSQTCEEDLASRPAVEGHLQQRSTHAVPTIGKASIDDRDEPPEALPIAPVARGLLETGAPAPGDRVVERDAPPIYLDDRKLAADPDQLRETTKGPAKACHFGHAKVRAGSAVGETGSCQERIPRCQREAPGRCPAV